MSRTTETVTVQLPAGMRIPTRTFTERRKTGDRVIKTKSQHWRERIEAENTVGEERKRRICGRRRTKCSREKGIRGGGNEAVSLFNEFGVKSGYWNIKTQSVFMLGLVVNGWDRNHQEDRYGGSPSKTYYRRGTNKAHSSGTFCS